MHRQKYRRYGEAIDELLSATSIPEEELEAVPFAEMTFSFQGSKEPLTVKDLINQTLVRLNKEISTPIPLLKREEWQKERNAKAKEIITTLQSQLLSVSKLHKKKINDVGKKMYLNAKQKIALAAETDKENMALRHRISELGERAVAHEKSRADAAEQKALAIVKIEKEKFCHISLKRYGDKEAASHFYKLIIGEEAWTEEDEIWWDT